MGKEDEERNKGDDQLDSFESFDVRGKVKIREKLRATTQSIRIEEEQEINNSSPCTKQEAVEVMVSHYADVCSPPDHPSFNQKKKQDVEDAITNIEQNIDAEADEDNNINIDEATVASSAKERKRGCPDNLISFASFISLNASSFQSFSPFG